MIYLLYYYIIYVLKIINIIDIIILHMSTITRPYMYNLHTVSSDGMG